MPNAGCGQNKVAVKSQKIGRAIGTTSTFERNMTVKRQNSAAGSWVKAGEIAANF
ncbi:MULTISPECIES: hypothetical protein [unclassified Microcoleus]|uniref:hypothetical protein n=1 Tax=unclassified Microcoleus TaxID=2642155 RepID=UPI002FD43F31